jgi:hypothetical protein
MWKRLLRKIQNLGVNRRVETKIFVFVFSRKVVFAFREISLRKVTEITKVFAKSFREKWRGKGKCRETSEFQEANEAYKLKECSGPMDPGNVQNQIIKTM